MAHFARLNENNEVVHVHVVNNSDVRNLEFPDSETVGQEYLSSIHGNHVWKQTSYNSNFRKQYAGVGYTFDEMNDVFVAPQPFPSWTLDENFDWQPPVPYPDDENTYVWDEDSLSWVSYG
jgi:hypothetical protein